MTPADYQKRNAELTAKIVQLENAIQTATNQAAKYGQNARQWILNKTIPCRGTANNKAACEKDNLYKDSKSLENKGYQQSELNKVEGYKTTIKQLQEEITKNIGLMDEAQASASQVSATLANQGLTFESVATTSNAQADAIREQATILATSQAQKMAVETDTDAKNKQVRNYVFVAAGILAIVIVAIVVIKKLKKKK